MTRAAKNDANEACILKPASAPTIEAYLAANVDDLVDRLGGIIAEQGKDPSALIHACERIRDSIHAHDRPNFDDARARYRKVDPDDDSPADATSAVHQSHGLLLDHVRSLIQRAGYVRLSPLEIHQATRVASEWGVHLRIRFSMFRVLEVYGRGDSITERPFRAWQRAFMARTVRCPIYQRVVVIIQPSDDASSSSLAPAKLHLRMFKNVPKADIDMLLPSKGIRFTWWDTGRIGIPTAWGFVLLASKLVKDIGLLTLLVTIKVMTSIVIGTAILVAAIVYGIKSIFSYLTTQRRYLLHVTQNLYYQNLAHNLGVMLRLFSEAEEQDALHAILVFYALWDSDDSEAMDEAWLRSQCDLLQRALFPEPVQLNLTHAIDTLYRAGLIAWQDRGWVRTNPTPWFREN